MMTNNLQLQLPLKLAVLKSLRKRMNLPVQMKSKISRLTKGYKGEKLFSSLLNDHLPKDTLILHNLLLEYQGAKFEIDSLLLAQNRVFIFEVKNFKGDFLIKNNKWYKGNDNFEVQNPLLQIERSEYLFRKLLTKLRFNFQIHTYLIFINNEFTLYSSSANKQIILPTQTRRFLKYLQTNPYNYSPTHYNLMEVLSRKQLSPTLNFYSDFPQYSFNELQKGIICTNCHSFLKQISRRYLKCDTCNSKITVDTAILNSIDEYHFLFPNRKITTSSIYQWCHIIQSKKTIRRILINNFQQVYAGRYTYYIYPKSVSNN